MDITINVTIIVGDGSALVLGGSENRAEVISPPDAQEARDVTRALEALLRIIDRRE